MPWRTAAMTAASLALSVVENRLLVSTCAVSAGQLRREGGGGEALQAGFGHLGIILIHGHATWVPRRAVAVAPIGIRARRRLPIDHVCPFAIGAEAHGVRVPAGGNETHHLVVLIRSSQRHDGDAVQIAIGHPELRPIRRERHAVGVGARKLRQRREWMTLATGER